MNNTGFYVVNGKTYTSKTLAAIDASKENCSMQWHFYNEVWEKFSKEKSQLLGRINLDYLYKQRAQQLRDKYDYLILNYSGGADSHNILMTFLNNGIALDEIYVTWSPDVDSKVYKPNTIITTAENLLSEWDYVLKPSLEWIAKTYPNIKITVKDPFSLDLNTLYSDTTLEKPGHYFGVFEMMRQNTIPDSITEQVSKGKSVGDIWGIDKPNILFDHGKAYLYFLDIVTYGVPRNVDSVGGSTELFYYSVDMPELAFEQGHKVLQYFMEHRADVEKLELIKMKRYDLSRYQWYNNLVKPIIYTTWDMRKFQVDKALPYSYSSRSRDLYYEKSNQFLNAKDRWQHHFKSFFNTLAPHILSPDGLSLRTVVSPKYYLGEF
jgi:hypothetical protein